MDGVIRRGYPRQWHTALFRLIVGLAVTTVVGVIAADPAAAQDGCDVPADPTWSKPETQVWRQLCREEWADFNRGEQTLDPGDADGWSDGRGLSSAFVEQLLMEPYATVIDRHGLRLRGAWFREILDVSEATVSFPLRCEDCRISGVVASDAVIDGAVDLSRSAVEGDLVVANADIGSQLVVNDASVSGTLDATNLVTAHDVFLTTSEFADISLHGADIGGGLEIDSGSVVSGNLNAPNVTVAESVFLNGSEFADISLPGADIGGSLRVDSGSLVSGALDATNVTVADSVFLDDGSEFADISLHGADIGRNLEVDSGSVLSGTLNATNVTVAGDLLLQNSEFGDVQLISGDIGEWLQVDGTTWSSAALLDLRDAHVGGIWTDSRGASWPPEILLNGFAYDQWVSPDPSQLRSRWFVDTWLARLNPFSSSPYEQLATVLDAQGHPTIAAEIRYGRSHAERAQYPWSLEHGPERLGRELHRLVLGYGLRPGRALIWFVALWVIGFVVLTTATELSASQAAIHSLDRLLPGIDLADKDELPDLTPLRSVWLTLQRLLGWVLTLFIVGWLGSLLVRS